MNKSLDFLKKYLTKKTIKIISLISVVVIVSFCVGKMTSSSSKTTQLGFENIGELATQAAYCTEVNVTESSRELFGITIPFTQSKYIYSYDIVIKAGFDFEKIEYDIHGKNIEVTLPEPMILSCDPDFTSFKVYHEKESIFRQVSISENNEAIMKLTEQAKNDAIANGFLDKAKANGELILKAFFASQYDLTEYSISFEYK